MSKQRQLDRARREARAATARRQAGVARTRAQAQRARQQRRVVLWRRVRLWQHGPTFHLRRETLGALATLVLLVLLVVFLVTRSVSDVLGTALICVIAGPVLVMLFFDRSRR